LIDNPAGISMSSTTTPQTDREARRVLFVTQTHNIWGGMEQWLHNFTLWLQTNTDWDVRVGMVLGRKFNDPEAYHRAHSHMVPIELDARVGTHSGRVKSLVKAIEHFDPDLIVPIATGDVFEAVAEAKRRGSRVRFVEPIRALVPELMVNVLDYWPVIDGVVSISRLIDRFFREHLPSDHERLHYIRHGARPASVAHDHSRFEQPDLPLRVAFAGRLEPSMKRIFDLVPFTEALIGLGTKAEIHVFGTGPSEHELQEALQATPLPVIFHGYKSQQELYAEAYPFVDVAMLFSGAGEGTPNVICEAMQNSVVLVVSRFPGQAGEAFVIHGHNGLTFAVGDVSTAAKHVDRLARDRALLRQMSDAARRNVENHTDVQMHQDWISVFDRTLSLPQKMLDRKRAIQRAGRLDRLLPPAMADGLRSRLGRYHQHIDGWGEWPGTSVASGERVAAVDVELREIDKDEQTRAGLT
jgi:glycosyltransferase involved in cell wall biosynthesis